MPVYRFVRSRFLLVFCMSFLISCQNTQPTGSSDEARQAAALTANECATKYRPKAADSVNHAPWTEKAVQAFWVCLSRNQVRATSAELPWVVSMLDDRGDTVGIPATFSAHAVWHGGKLHVVYYVLDYNDDNEAFDSGQLHYVRYGFSATDTTGPTMSEEAREIVDTWLARLDTDDWATRIELGWASASLAFDASGAAHVVFYKAHHAVSDAVGGTGGIPIFTETLAYRIRNADGTWAAVPAADTVIDAAVSGRYAQLAIAPGGSIHIVSQDSAAHKIDYLSYTQATDESWAWSKQQISDDESDPDSTHMSGLSLALREDSPVIGYVSSSAAGSGPRLTTFDSASNSWISKDVGTDGVIGSTTIAVGSDSLARICYTTSLTDKPFLRCDKEKEDETFQRLDFAEFHLDPQLVLGADDTYHLSARRDKPIYHLLKASGVGTAQSYEVSSDQKGAAYFPTIAIGDGSTASVHLVFQNHIEGADLLHASTPVPELVPDPPAQTTFNNYLPIICGGRQGC